jgi:hypothetical protein
MRVYISGPITGKKDLNRPMFDAAAQWLRERGFEPVNPFDVIDQEVAEREGWQWSDYMRRDIAALTTCDRILMLSRWRKSKGATMENSIAKKLGITELHGFCGVDESYFPCDAPSCTGEAIKFYMADADPYVRGCCVDLLRNAIADLNAITARFDLAAHLRRQIAFSERTFGPGDRTAGVCDHIRKELAEVEADYAAGNPTLPEWVDVIILALDGAWRSGATPDDICKAISEKLMKNERRTWPDWRTAEPDKAIEHVRDVAA